MYLATHPPNPLGCVARRLIFRRPSRPELGRPPPEVRPDLRPPPAPEVRPDLRLASTQTEEQTSSFNGKGMELTPKRVHSKQRVCVPRASYLDRGSTVIIIRDHRPVGYRRFDHRPVILKRGHTVGGGFIFAAGPHGLEPE